MHTSSRITLLALIAVFVATTGLSCGSSSAGTQRGAPAPVTLDVWRVFDPSSSFQEIINGYQTLHPNVQVRYRTFTYDSFEKELVNALAEDRGPDIISLQNAWVPSYLPKIEPMPASITVPYLVVKGSLKKESFTELRTTPTVSLRQLRDRFADVVESDVVVDGKIYGLPMAVDTLGMYYNKDLLKNAGIVNPPTSWASFQDQVVKLTKMDQRGMIVQSAASIGTGTNIPRAFDLLSVLMMQNGATMIEDGRTIAFNRTPRGSGRATPPGLDALSFYTDFASPAKQVYTWNSTLPSAQEAFIQGRTAFYFDYSFAYDQIRARAPKLNFDIAPIPQIEGNSPVNYANYWVETVSKKSKNKEYAWDFILYATAQKNVASYLAAGTRPTALKALIESQRDDLVLAPFVTQTLTAQSWYHGKNPASATDAFKTMIQDMLAGTGDPVQIINLAAARVAQTY